MEALVDGEFLMLNGNRAPGALETGEEMTGRSFFDRLAFLPSEAKNPALPFVESDGPRDLIEGGGVLEILVFERAGALLGGPIASAGYGNWGTMLGGVTSR